MKKIFVLFNFLIIVSMVISFTTSTAYASSRLIPTIDVGWQFSTIMQDLRETIIIKINSGWGDHARLESSQTAQAKLEELMEQGKPVPNSLFDRVEEKIDNIKPSITSLNEEVWDTFRIVAETNEIRKILTDIQSNQYTPNSLQQRVNGLESVKKYCNYPPSIIELLALRENQSGTSFETEEDMRKAYKRLQEICPALKDYDAEKAYELLNKYSN